jgi:hypothetical protein
MALLKGNAGTLDMEMEEGTLWEDTLLHLTDEATDETGDPEPFEAGTLAYITIRDEIGGTVLAQLGPADDGLDGTTEVTPETGAIAYSLPVQETIGLAFPSDGSPGVVEVLIYPGGDEDRAYRLLEGALIYNKRVSVLPEVGS